ncbi:MAG: type II toxin-antitoxin system HicA family toxin [Chromatium okenii]|nr:type II toxin-antitoxin system HicA family toxin [Chromatium okenii]
MAALEKAGFSDRGGKGSHRNYIHPKMIKPITVSGQYGDDAQQYLIKAVQKAIKESQQ